MPRWSPWVAKQCHLLVAYPQFAEREYVIQFLNLLDRRQIEHEEYVTHEQTIDDPRVHMVICAELQKPIELAEWFDARREACRVFEIPLHWTASTPSTSRVPVFMQRPRGRGVNSSIPDVA